MSNTDPHHGSLNESNIVKLVSDEFAKFELNNIITLVQKPKHCRYHFHIS